MTENNDVTLPDGINRILRPDRQAAFVITARRRDSVEYARAASVQLTSTKPPMVCAAVTKGAPVMALVSGSRRFRLCRADSTPIARMIHLVCDLRGHLDFEGDGDLLVGAITDAGKPGHFSKLREPNAQHEDMRERGRDEGYRWAIERAPYDDLIELDAAIAQAGGVDAVLHTKQPSERTQRAASLVRDILYAGADQSLRDDADYARWFIDAARDALSDFHNQT